LRQKEKKRHISVATIANSASPSCHPLRTSNLLQIPRLIYNTYNINQLQTQKEE
jgi:hypothetical protein